MGKNPLDRSKKGEREEEGYFFRFSCLFFLDGSRSIPLKTAFTLPPPPHFIKVLFKTRNFTNNFYFCQTYRWPWLFTILIFVEVTLTICML